MKYVLLIHTPEEAWTRMSDGERQQAYDETMGVARQLSARGQYLAGARLQTTAAATSIRVRDGRRLVSDGPCAETSEQLGGYLLIEARDLDEAIAIAARLPGACRGTVEIRPVIETRDPGTF